ncbi:hypothetical protein ES703_40040 [subsurface metagenome]
MQNKIREHREKAGLSQTKLSIAIGVAGSNLSAIECGRMQAWPKVRKALARVFKVKQSDLFPEDGSGGKTGS